LLAFSRKSLAPWTHSQVRDDVVGLGSRPDDRAAIVDDRGRVVFIVKVELSPVEERGDNDVAGLGDGRSEALTINLPDVRVRDRSDELAVLDVSASEQQILTGFLSSPWAMAETPALS